MGRRFLAFAMLTPRRRVRFVRFIATGIGGALGLTGVLALAVVAAIVYGVGEGALIPSLQDAAMTVAPPSQRGGVLAVWVGFIRLGQTVGPLAATAMIAWTSTSTTIVAGGAVGLLLVALKLFGPLDDEAIAAATPKES